MSKTKKQLYVRASWLPWAAFQDSTMVSLLVATPNSGLSNVATNFCRWCYECIYSSHQKSHLKCGHNFLTIRVALLGGGGVYCNVIQ